MNIIGLREELVTVFERYGLNFSPDNMESAIREITEWVWEYEGKEEGQELVQIIKQGEKICDCPECGATIINGFSPATLRIFRESKLFKNEGR